MFRTRARARVRASRRGSLRRRRRADQQRRARARWSAGHRSLRRHRPPDPDQPPGQPLSHPGVRAPMLVARRGKILSISSIVGLRGYRGLVACSATKAALDSATRALARRLGDRGIMVNSIAAGFLETEMTHGLGRIAAAADRPTHAARAARDSRRRHPGRRLPALAGRGLHHRPGPGGRRRSNRLQHARWRFASFRSSPLTFPSFRRFSERTWSRPKTDAYYRWRYLECPSLLGYLALDGDECVASLWAFLSPYRIAGRGRDVPRDLHDWFCRPDLRGSGIGVRLMQTMMRRTEPIVTVGAGPDARWRCCRDSSGGARAITASTRCHSRAAPWAPTWRVAPDSRPHGRARRFGSLRGRGSRRAPPGAGRAESSRRCAEIGAEVVDLYRRSGNAGIVPLPDPARIRWFVNAVEELGRFLPLQFRVARNGPGLVVRARVSGPPRARRPPWSICSRTKTTTRSTTG